MRSRVTNKSAPDPLPQALLNASAFPHPVQNPELIETHISWLILTGEFVYKIKKPVSLSFLDFSTIARRHFFCEEEMRLNSRFAPELYLGVVPIGGTRAAPRIGATPAIEYAVKLKQFPHEARLDRQLAREGLDFDDVARLADDIARYQATLADDSTDPTFGSSSAIIAVARDNLAELASLLSGQDALVAQFREWTDGEAERLTDAFDDRKAAGFAREGHGDLHLENLVRLDDDRIVPFDCLEFDARMRWTDTVDEVAFLAMDLMAHGRHDLGWAFLNRYFERTGDYAGLAILRFYLVYRALVRAKVCLLRGQTDTNDVAANAGKYLDLAATLTHKTRPLLILTHGLSGSGKTVHSEPLVGHLGAIRIRSDVERKRLHGLDALADSDSSVNDGVYSPSATHKTYEVLAQAAAHGLAGGLNIIVDATFLKKCQRERFRDLAADHCARRVIIDCRAPLAELRSRVAHRRDAANDASEATQAVLSAQIAEHEPLCWDEQCSQVLIDSANAAYVPSLIRQILAIGKHPLDRAR